MPIPARKEEFRPSSEEVSDRLLETDKFKTALLGYLMAMDGSPKYWAEAGQTFIQTVKTLSARAEDHLREEMYSSDEGWEHA